VRKFIGEEIWREYVKIVITRNPWDMLVSHYFFAHQFQKKFCPAYFDKFVTWNMCGTKPMNKGYWLIGGNRWADVYLRFEHIQSDWEKLIDEIGLPHSELPRILVDYRPRGIHYSVMYSDRVRRIVRERYQEEIDEFGYKFEHCFARFENNASNLKWNTDRPVQSGR
jgi:hypothetical protein